MDFSLTEEQNELAGLISDVLTRECGPGVVRAGWPDGDPAVVARLWRLLGDVGLFALLVDEAHGGLGLDEGFLVPALQPIGTAAVPGPVTDTIVIVAPALAAAGHPLAGDVLEGKALVACGVGRRGPIPYASTADAIVLDNGVRIVVHDAADVTIDPVDSVDGGRQLARVSTSGSGFELAVGAQREMMLARATLGTTAELVGLGERLLAMAVHYVGERNQFGVPIGSFQAVKHQLSDVRVALSFARPLALKAGWMLATGAPGSVTAVSSAKAAANQAARQAARTSLQCHGAIAYTDEYDYHLYAKRVWSLLSDRGDTTSHRLIVADSLGLPPLNAGLSKEQ